MAVWSTIRTCFFENIWPLIQSFPAVVIEKTLEWLSEQVNKFLDDSAAQLAQKARISSQEELEKADQTDDQAEADKHRAVAEVWQKVAADIMEENARIKGQLAKVFEREKAEFVSRIGALQPDDVFDDLSGEKVKLKIGSSNLVVSATILRESDSEKTRQSP